MSYAKSRLERFTSQIEAEEPVTLVTEEPTNLATDEPSAKAKKSRGPAKPLTINFDAETRRRIIQEASSRKARGLPNWTIRDVVTQAVAAYFQKPQP